MTFSIIAAIASNNVIGKNNKLPWHIPEDLDHFYNLIDGKTVVMGHKTYESIGKPIKNSRNVVLSHNSALQLPGCMVVNSVAEVLNLCRNDAEVMIIGGTSVYRQFLPLANKMYLTFIDQQFDGDAYFPEWKNDQWDTITEQEVQTGSYRCRFITLHKSEGSR